MSVIAISAIIYYLFYLITSPHALNRSQTQLAKAIENNDEVAFEASINAKLLRAKSGPGRTSLSIAIDNGNIHFVAIFGVRVKTLQEYLGSDQKLGMQTTAIIYLTPNSK